jgi:hypothetical protein
MRKPNPTRTVFVVESFHHRAWHVASWFNLEANALAEAARIRQGDGVARVREVPLADAIKAYAAAQEAAR